MRSQVHVKSWMQVVTLIMIFGVSVWAQSCPAPDGLCKPNTETQTYACPDFERCAEKSAINNSETCAVNDTFWSSNNCKQGKDAAGDLPKYTPVQYPNKAETAGSQWKCQAGVDEYPSNIPIWKYFATPDSASCTWQETADCICNNAVYQAPVGKVTQCRSS
jgi:hypothetical protein